MARTSSVVFDRDQIRALDAAAITELGLPSLLLMENAARGVCEVLARECSACQIWSVSTEDAARSVVQELWECLQRKASLEARVRYDDFVQVTSKGQFGDAFVSLCRRGLCSQAEPDGDVVLCGPRILIVCGPGNNGGDGLAIARQLAAVGVPFTVALIDGDRSISPDVAANLAFLSRSQIDVHRPSPRELSAVMGAMTGDDVIVDCLLGTGVRGAPKAPFEEVIEAISRSGAFVVSADVPSGLNCQTGSADGSCVEADITVTFVGLKTGFLSPAAERFLGKTEVAHIGLPAHWVREFHARTHSS